MVGPVSRHHAHHAGESHDCESPEQPDRTREKRGLVAALALQSVVMVAEFIGGRLTGSLALTADAGHMLTDVSALALSLLAFSFATRPADPRRTYGYPRLEILAALANGVILTVLALVIIYNATRTLNFAQGDMLMVSAFIGWTAHQALGLPLWAAAIVAVLASGLLALVLERLVIRRSISATHWDVLIITLGLSLMLRAGAGLVWTHDEFPFPSFFDHRPIALGAVRLSPGSLGIIGASLAIMTALWLLFTTTRAGRAMRAVAQNQNAARLMGISVERVYSASWVLAAAVGAVAGILVAPVIFLSSKMGFIVINGFTAAVIGGFGSMPGAFVGGMVLGVI